jgi:glutamate dehydrogenase
MATFRLRRVALRRTELSSILPVLESFGLAVVEAVPWRFALTPNGRGAYVDDFSLRVGTTGASNGFDLEGSGPDLVDAIRAVISGDAETNVLNRLVVDAGLRWRQVNLLCAYRAYRDVAGGQRASERADAIDGALVAFPRVALALVGLFEALLVPASGRDSDQARSEVGAALAQVPDLAPYEALSEVAALVEATVRTNWALGKGPIALKLASPRVPFLPEPKPVAEVFVWSPWFEALHLRFGLVARGGIRWSERQSDMRTEVLGLAKAQVKKNSIIVPTGAKGAFVLRKGPSGRERAEAAYSAFVGALLDVTDNFVDGAAVHPRGVECRDGDDPYLVVAPDKGTAAFSDLANAISTQRGFWLGDAFASGGSRGYDHKVIGITARGTWLAVRRHFRALGMDAQQDPLRVVGVGDMSGDVFGNGLLQSRAVQLVAAFDHRHIFVDPSPDPDRSYEERKRMSRLERSCWEDYDLATASEGAAVFSRQAKQIELSPQARAALGVRPGLVSPPELVKAILRAPVDLIFFGGIGTFVKAPAESDAEVDDSSNDDVRVGSDELRARVVAEGANLAVTQMARASYSRRGGRVNGDFVDNAAGVAMSDREVNLKVLFGLARAGGRLDDIARDEMLVAVQETAAREVLAQVLRSIVALDAAAASSAGELPTYAALMEDLGRAGLLNAEVEALPGAEELARRKSAGAGFSRPELAVLLAYARSELARSIDGSDLVADPALCPCAHRYFPELVREAFPDLLGAHPLFGQLLASELANEVIHRMGAMWAHEVAAETGRQLWEVAEAYWTAREVLGVGDLLQEADRLAWSVPVDAEAALTAALRAGLNRLARWYLGRSRLLKAGETIEQDRPVALELDHLFPPAGELSTDLVNLGLPTDFARQAEQLTRLAATGELAQVARTVKSGLRPVLGAYQVIEEGLGLPLLVEGLGKRGGNDRWERVHAHLLGDDIARVRAEAVEEALAYYPAETGAEAGRLWLAAKSGPLAHAFVVAGELAHAAVPSAALGALAVRALADVVKQ